MLRKLFIIMLLACSGMLQAQQLKVVVFHADFTMTDAIRFPKKDFNGEHCGLIKLGLALPMSDVTFEGDIISFENKAGEWWIYMPKGSNWLTIKSKSNTYLPLRCEFKDYGINGIETNVTYIMNVEKPQLGTEYNDHDYVDLGLPSGILWATCNMGARRPEDYGDYYAWGETFTKSVYNWDTYKYANGDYNMTKYRSGHDVSDSKTTLEWGDDPATNWNGGWFTPSKEQWTELLENTTNQWTMRNGVNGRLFTSKKNGQTLFLPAAGNRLENELNNIDSIGFYWSRERSCYMASAWYLYLDGDECKIKDYYCDLGFSVRPVRRK